MVAKFFRTSLLTVLLSSATVVVAGTGPYLGGSINIVDNVSGHSSFRGLTGSVMGGFGGAVNEDTYLAGELFADIGTLVLDNNTSLGSPTLRTTYSYGISIIPGLMLSNRTMAYVRIGLLKTNFTGLTSSVTGAQFGLGMQTSITQYWDMRLEYDYVPYQNTKGVSPSADQFKLGFIYKFN